MASIDNIVTVTITKGTKTVPLPGFGIPLIMGPSNRFAETYHVYDGATGASAMLDDGFLTSDPEYKHAVALTSQANKPTTFIVGKNTAPVAQVSTVSITSVLNSTLYSVTINGVVCSYTSDSSATGAEIQAGLIAAINASTEAPNVTASAGAGTDVTVTSDELGLGFSITVNTNLSVTTGTANHSIVDDLVTLQGENDNWYALMISSNLSADIRQVAGWVETQKKIFGACSSEAGILTSSTSDLASYLKGKNYERTFLIYGATPADAGEAAWIGQMVPLTPGSATWKFKQLVGITADNLNGTQVSNAQGKKANLYIPVGGVDITTEGVVASGEYIDVTIFIDWLVATMQANVYGILINNPKIPYTDKGIGAVENAVRQTLRQGIDNGGLSDNPAPTVSVPKAADVPTNDKATRTLNNVVFTGTLAGAIHKVNIRGYISV